MNWLDFFSYDYEYLKVYSNGTPQFWRFTFKSLYVLPVYAALGHLKLRVKVQLSIIIYLYKA